MLKQYALALVLIAAPVAVFSGSEHYFIAATPAEAAAAPLGDLSAMKTIVADVQAIAAKGDMPAAEKRITDFETAWDEAEPTLRPMNKDAWGNVDGAADAALKALRAKTPDAAKVASTLAGLAAALDNPAAAQ